MARKSELNGAGWLAAAVAGVALAAGTAMGQQGPTVEDEWIDDTVVPGDPAMEPPGDVFPVDAPVVPGEGDLLTVDGLDGDLPPGEPERVYMFDVTTGRLVDTITPSVVPGEEENSAGDPAGEPPGPTYPEGSGDRGSSRNMTGYSTVGDTTAYPYRRTVRIVMVFQDENNNLRTFTCSGTMIDSRHVLTAGHCLYAHDDGNGVDIDDWPVDVWVYPAYDDDDRSYTNDCPSSCNRWCNTNNANDWDCDEWDGPLYDEGDFPYGGSRAKHVWAMNGWVDHEWKSYDVGWIRLDRPVGALTGWSSYGYSSKICSWWKNAFWWNDGYPAEPGVQPLDGMSMQERSGDFDSCPLIRRKRIDSLSWGGSSGSAAVRSYNGSRTAFAVLSTSDRVSRTDFCRLTDGAFYGIRDDSIGAARPSSPDVIPLKVETGFDTILAGDNVLGLTYKIHNYSDGGAWFGNILVKVYLSTNRNITEFDTLIGTRNVNVTIPVMQTASVNAAAPFPVIPQDTPPGQYYIGVILDVADSDTSNNNTKRWDSAPVTITGLPDLWAQNINAVYDEYGPGESVPVNFAVKNEGNLESGNWTGDFYASTDLNFDGGDTLIASGGAPSLDPGETGQYADDIPLNGLLPGTYHMIIYVEAENGDSDYADNWTVSSTPFDVVACVGDGDVDFDGQVTVADISYVIFRLASGGPTRGEARGTLTAGDADCDGDVDSNDIAYVIFRLQPGGPT